MYLWLHRINPLDGPRMLKHKQLLSFSSLLCFESSCFWNILWSCHHYDSKHFSIKSTRKCSFCLFLLHYNGLNCFSCSFWINCKLYGSIKKSTTLRSFNFWICIVKLSRISTFLVVGRKRL